MTMRTLPLFPLNTVLFPSMPLPLVIFEERYKAMFSKCLAGDHRFGSALIASGVEVGGNAVPHPVGTVARIVSWEKMADERIKLLATGEQRFRLIETLDTDQPFQSAVVEYWEDEQIGPGDETHVLRDLGVNFVDYLTLVMLLSGHSLPVGYFDLPSDPSALSYHVARSLQIDLTEKQRLLEEPSAVERLQRELLLVRRERDFLQRLVSLHGVVGDLDMRWGLTKLSKGNSSVNHATRRDGSGGK
jgi:Lon protease-like protein